MKKNAKMFFALVGLTSLVACGLLGKDEPDPPDIPGKIVFSAKDNIGNYQIYTMKANGSHLKKLTDWLIPSTQPSWSPDGKKIVFSSFKNGTSIGPALWVMNADGSNKHVLYDSTPNDPNIFPLLGKNAQWSPDGSKIAFDLCLNCQIATDSNIYVFDISSKELTQLADHPGSDFSPAWSPDGSRIVFVSDRAYPIEGGSDIYLMDKKGNNIVRLTNTGNAGRPIWCHNGKNLLYWSKNKLYKLNLVNMEPNLITVKVNKEIGFRPLDIASNNNLILLHTFSYANPRNNQSLQVLDLQKNKIINIYSNKAIYGVDWLVSTKTKN